ncbi:MAG: hypothetical protein ACLVGL_13595 [Waltera sp.]
MKYGKIVEGKFIDRPNRFIAHVEIAGKAETVHVRNTGRCRELLLPGAAVRLEQSDNPARKTLYDAWWLFIKTGSAGSTLTVRHRIRS